MPLVSHNKLPTFDRLRAEGQEVLAPNRAEAQDIRELHVGLLNMMPDAALQATERQFLRLVGACNRIAQFHIHPFTVPGIPREGAAREYVDEYYLDFDDVVRDGLDALVITGANPLEADITREPFWDGMKDVMDWAQEHVCSTLMSCLASHGAFQIYHGIERTPLADKKWGVFAHRVVAREHPLVATVNTRFPAPHSRWNDVPPQVLRDAGMRVLVESDDAGFFLATSSDGFRFIYFQGHPEYDSLSLPKEYKREVNRFLSGDRDTYPQFPENAFEGDVADVLNHYRDEILAAINAGRAPPRYPDERVDPRSDNTWTDTGKAIFNNWLGLVYQTTDLDRTRPFMPGINPLDPLKLSGQ